MSTRTMVWPPKVALDPPLGPDEGEPAGATPGLVAGAPLTATVGLQQNGSRPENTRTFLCLPWLWPDGLGAGVGEETLDAGGGAMVSDEALVPLLPRRKN